MKNNNIRINLDLPEDLAKQIKYKAKENGIAVNALIRLILYKYINDNLI